MKITLILQTLLTLVYTLQYGPCRDVTPVEVDNKEWEDAKGLYVNVQPVERDAHCEWVFHYLTHDDSGEVYPSYYLKHMKNESELAETWSGKQVGPGHYVTTSQLMVDRNSTVHTYFLYFDPPNLICHFTCTDDPYFSYIKGGLVCESPSPDATLGIAPVIRQVAEINGFDLEDLMIVDNCKTNNKCSNYIPFEHGADSKCTNVTIRDYFEL